MANANSISPETLEQIDLILSCITASAKTIKILSDEILESGGDLATVGALCEAIECVSSQVGYLADDGLGRIGSPKNSAESWFLPARLQNTRISNAATNA